MPDPTTQSNYAAIVTKHVALEWTIDFKENIISGSAMHTLFTNDDLVKEVIFDTSDLDIKSVLLADEPVEFCMGDKHPVMGSALKITFPSALPHNSEVKIKIIYSVGKEATALQFLEPEQTKGRQYPYLFSQCQPIHARSLVPLQDTPSVKLTYSANVTSVLPVLMSAIRISPPSDGPLHDGKVIGKDAVTYSYNQPIPIPSYLIAIASGNVRFKAFPRIEGKDWTSGIWAEPETIDDAHWEFCEDTGRFLAAEEQIVGPYKFGVYELVVLPPSFPYGGMENACCTFLTPTLLAGDRTLVDVVVHELTHSWFGNGITHTDASHFWLNEGWTTYIERVLQQVLHSPAHRGLSYLIGYKSLQDALRQFESTPKYQRLIIDFEFGEDPDDAYSKIPYEKGSNFLLHLEQSLGGLDEFLPYVREYVSKFMGKSINTNIWRSHLYEYWGTHGGKDKLDVLDAIDWNAWFYGEGTVLPVQMEYDMTLAKQAYELSRRWHISRSKLIAALDFKKDDLDHFDSNQKVVFLERLQSYPALPPEHITHLGKLYSLVDTLNDEIRFRFYELALLDHTTPEAKGIAEQAASWVIGDDETGVIKGRMKFCRPLFRSISRTNSRLAQTAFKKHKMEFHPIARRLIEKDLNIT